VLEAEVEIVDDGRYELRVTRVVASSDAAEVTAGDLVAGRRLPCGSVELQTGARVLSFFHPFERSAGSDGGATAGDGSAAAGDGGAAAGDGGALASDGGLVGNDGGPSGSADGGMAAGDDGLFWLGVETETGFDFGEVNGERFVIEPDEAATFQDEASCRQARGLDAGSDGA
jgi:hypothetical protein